VAVNDFIKIQRDQSAATEAAELLQWVRDLRSVYERGSRIRAKMRHNFSDAGGVGSINWVAVQTLWGIPTNGTDVGAAANGSRVFTLVDGTVGSLEGTFQVAAGRDVTETVG
jgi:hypothetical protein